MGDSLSSVEMKSECLSVDSNLYLTGCSAVVLMSL